MQEFSEIAREFYYSTLQDGFDALFALRDVFEEVPTSERSSIIIKEMDQQEQDQDDILF